MKKLILIILLLIVSLNANAAHVPMEKAKKAALNWFNHAKIQADNPPKNKPSRKRTRKADTTTLIKDVYVQQKDETDIYYIVNMNPTGFVVVSADDAVDPILAYSFESTMDQENINPAAQEFLDSYSTQISHVISKEPKIDEINDTWSTMTSDTFSSESKVLDEPAMPPLLSTKWDVNADYNLFSPGLGSVKTDTGEMAMTMAQVLRYWNYPESGIGEHSYTPRCIPELGEQYANFHNTIYDYSKMPDQLTAESTPEEISAVAELIYHCGVSVETNYLLVRSSASISDGFDALIKYFDYSMTSLKLLYKTAYSDEDWKNILFNELNNYRVVICLACHKFICDGYQGTDFFHFNFGCGGDGDGYYRLDLINPIEDNPFSALHTIIAGIQPNNIYETQTLLAENFENTFLPNGWSLTIVNNTSPSPQWSQVNSGTNPTCSPYSGTNMIAFNSNACPSGAEARLILPDIDLTTKDYAKLTFYMFQDSGETDKTTEGVTFQFSEDGTNWQNLKFIPRYSLSTGWHECRIDLTYYKGKTIKIGMLGHSEGGNNMYLDHFTLKYVVPGSFFTSDKVVSYPGAPISFEDTSFGPNQRINSNTGIVQHVANWATHISAGPANEDQTLLRFQTIAENDALLEGGQKGIFISSEGDLTYTPTATANGTITVTVILEDGGTGRYTSGEQTFTITLKTTNQAPSFVKGSHVTIDEDEALTITIQSWATNISPGASNEMNQQLEFHLSPDNSGLFAIPPKIMIDKGNVGHLFFAPAKNAFGSSTVSVYLKDNAGTALGGVDTSDSQEFIITINPVNDPPVFTKGPNIIIKQNTSKTIDNWAKGISFGPANETGQLLTFHTTAVPDTLFIDQPQISSTGTLTFKTSSSHTGIATVSVYLDDSATNNNTSTTETFTINVTATSPPQLSEIEDYEILQDQAENILIEVIDEDTPINDISVTATSSNTELVNTNNLALSIINAEWILSITPISGQSGVTTITVSADDGSKATDKTFILTVHAIPSAQISVVSDQYSTTTGTVPLLVHFTPASIQNENEITGWRWDFGDGRTSSDKSPLHTFYLDDDLNDPSVYTVRLTTYGFNDSSSADTKTNYITINRLKYANFNAINKVGSENLRVDFINQSIGFGTNTIFQWNFGDGTKSSLENPSHTYTDAGIYSVSLAVSNGSITRTMSKPDFVKVSGRSISGQIIASDTTLGIENCRVEIWSVANNVLLAYTHTAPDGSYSIKELPSLDHLIIGAWPPLALRDQYYKAFYDGAHNRFDAKKVSILTSSLASQNITLEKIPEMGIRGRILDMDGITGLANSDVDVFSDHLQTGSSATTDAEGFYTVTGLQNASDYIVSTWSENLNMEFFYSDTGTVFTPKYATKIELAGVYVDHITITVLPSGSISGHVSLNDQPLANIWISAWSDILGIGNKALSNEFGDYTISGLISQSNAKNMTYIVACRSQDYPYQAYNNVSDRSLASPVSTDRTDIDFNIKTGNDIKGIVTDSNNNVLSGVSISAWSESKNIKGEAISQTSGEYTLCNMPLASDYKLIATSIDYPVQYYNQQKSSETAMIVDNTYGDVDYIDFILNKGGIIKGYVKIENEFTAASAGIWVNIWSKSTNTGGNVVTDVNGMYEISGLEPAVSDYKISICQDNYMPAFFNSSETVYESKDAESVTPSTTEYRNIVLKSGFTITGKITDAAGTPVAGIVIEAFSEQNNGWGQDTSTGTLVNDTNYTIKGLIPGTYNITISPENYISETKTKIVNADILNVDYRLIAPDRKISGSITGLDLNKEIFLTARLEEFNDSNVIRVRGTGNAIKYEITGLKPASDYRVDLRSSDYPYQVYNGKTEWDTANVLDLTDSDCSGINFVLESANLIISGTLTFPTLNYEQVWVEAYSKELNFTKGVHINYIGKNPVSYQIAGLMKGSYIVSIWPEISKSQYYDGSETEKNAQAVDLNTGSKTNINFTVMTGAFIEGYVYETDGKPASSVKVLADSKNSDSWGFAQTDRNGFYRIEGLDTVNDFIVQTQKTGMAALYFNSKGSVTKIALAEMVNANSSNINMTFFVIESISGMIRGTNGERISSSIRVIAKSEINQIENSVYTSYIGTYKIDGLIPGNDYKITAEPYWSSPYMSQSKTNISTNSTDINFMLEKGYSIEGFVSSHSTVISDVKIEVLSIDADCYAFVKTDINGHYEISGLKPATDYAVTATPPEESSYLVSINEHIKITTDYTFNILLESAFNMSGHIYESNGAIPVPAVRITVFSSDQNFMSDAITDASGYYCVENIPEASDYVVTAIPSNFAQQKRTDQSSGNTVDFILFSGGSISGSVDTSAGPFENATVEVFSETLNISKSVTTDVNGNYQITGLQQYWNSILVSNYVVTVYASGYPNESKGQKSVGDVVNFTLTKGEENEISGIIKDSTGALLPADSEIVWIKVFLNGVYQTKAKVKQDGTGAFTVNGLQPNTNYTLQVSDSTKNEWIGSDGIGVSDSGDAAVFTTSDTVDFSFGVEVSH
ncbi:MAG: carboxypeptidase regulatory-like domain-containing protein [Candidatus Magnetomorum sp.]|nr:carboxypeptidase regulatory-like domain-containing protein [Candidatus Magnetomorum sp.]